MWQPDIDVVIPCKNGAAFLKDCLDSIDAQTFLPSRIILVDDHSEDSSIEIAMDWATAHPQVPLQIVGCRGTGIAAARNEGIKASSSSYVAFLDSDDMWKERKLEKQIQVFISSPFASTLGLVYCGYSLIDEDGQEIQSKRIIPPRVRGSSFRGIACGNFISGSASAAVVRRDMLFEVGLFDENLKMVEDWDLWRRLAKISKFDYSFDADVLIRQHNNQSQSNEIDLMVGSVRHFDKWLRNGYVNFCNYFSVLGKIVMSSGGQTLERHKKNLHPITRMVFSPLPRTLFQLFFSWRLRNKKQVS